jgi:hypothetical protein
MDCPTCGSDSDFAQWLDRVTFASFLKKWICSHCPACGADYEIRPQRSGAVIGNMDGAPGPAFIPHKTHRIPGVSVRWSAEAVQVRHGGRTWKFPTQTALSPKARRL